jgi:hypothetical protein
VTDDSSLRAWHRARLKPPTEYAIRVAYEEREAAKTAGCRWRPELKQWVFACHGPPPRFVLKRSLNARDETVLRPGEATAGAD